jgi:hypothetical protein
MIHLDGNFYYVEKADYADRPGSPSTYSRGLLGLPLTVESGIMTQDPTFTLNINQAQSEALKASFTKCHATGVYLDYIDERGMYYHVAAGADNATNKYGTGVWMATLSEAKPTEALFDKFGSKWYTPQKRFTIQVSLVVNAIALA